MFLYLAKKQTDADTSVIRILAGRYNGPVSEKCATGSPVNQQ
jgi:hypothetical protein